jgi:hypothetical protein
MDYRTVAYCPEAVTRLEWGRMVDLTEIEALKASLRGALRAAEALSSVASRTEAADPRSDVADADLDELQRLSLANAVAAQALRGLVESMLKRRGKIAEPIADATGGIEE